MSTKPKIGIAGFGLEGKAVYGLLKGINEIHIFDEADVSHEGVDAVFHKSLVIPADIAIVYKSPGIPTSKLNRESPETQISTLMELALQKVRDRSVGVTGTKGKSTVASLICHILKESGRDAVLFGNIGIADMGLFAHGTSDRVYVFEFSSYQLEHLVTSPHVAVLTNLYPEHLDHHGSFKAYREAKLNIARFQKKGDTFVNASTLSDSFDGTLVRPVLGEPFETQLLGEHNQMNCATAVAAVGQLGVSEEEARKHVRTFMPLPYRMEKVGEFKSVTFYDDSLATVPEATRAALAALPQVDTLILGGQDRGLSFEGFAKELANSSVKTFIVFPDTGAKMVAAVRDRTIIPVQSMEEAVHAAFAHTKPGGTVLLSSASPSFNMFKDYKDKSLQYRQAIRAQSL